VAAWTGAPLVAIRVGSTLQAGTQPTMVAVAASVVILAFLEFGLVIGLTNLNERYDAAIGRRPTTRRPPPWHSSLSGEREKVIRREEGVTAVERIVAISCGSAVLALEIWFFFVGSFKDSPI